MHFGLKQADGRSACQNSNKQKPKSLDWGPTTTKPVQKLVRLEISNYESPPLECIGILITAGRCDGGMTFEDSVVPWQHGEASFVLPLTLIAAAVGEGCSHRVLIKTTCDSSSFGQIGN
ncbi:hypothetical protein CDAR_62191 [Caerostris darwini]|uniref:Uncharacterized protein n=1 Tax=Caerostris darwini TaxID=1538125 RepID=A0AAV4MVY6_9ARAC|nr:hypothetical protein CDAR_62191 [Caerostris darwini]